jgi:hypothetical protein
LRPLSLRNKLASRSGTTKCDAIAGNATRWKISDRVGGHFERFHGGEFCRPSLNLRVKWMCKGLQKDAQRF